MLTTPLHAQHLAMGAKMGEFAGYDMPLYYLAGVVQEHEWTRTQAGLFDVSHMGQAIVSGAGAQNLLEKLTPSSYGALGESRAKYTVLTNEQGGIIDDLIVTRMDTDTFFLVINAGCKEKDLAWIAAHKPMDVTLEPLTNRALLALQGPQAEIVLREVLGIEAMDLPYMAMQKNNLLDTGEVFVSRLGYTGEDGFELSMPATAAPAMWDALCRHPAVKPIGLAARDSLRLEMGYCLYGHDIDGETTPREAGLGWAMSKQNESYIGADAVAARGMTRQRVGLRLTDKGIAREGAVILDATGKAVGRVTSGSFSPTLKTPIAQGYVPVALAKPGTAVQIEIRGKPLAAMVSSLPFMPPKTKVARKT